MSPRPVTQTADTPQNFLNWLYGQHPQWSESKSCRHCGRLVDSRDAAVVTSYWWKVRFVAHRECASIAEREEAEGCREIDKNCSDCLYFQNGKFDAQGVRHGECVKFAMPKSVWPREPMAHENADCFELRTKHGVGSSK